MSSANPVWYLTKYLWRFSYDRKRYIVFYIFLFIIANLIQALEPFIFGSILNLIQLEGFTQPWKIFGLLCLFPLTTIGFWLFHGPARVIEERNAYEVSNYFRRYLLNGVLSLPAKWHAEHHSGNTLDKIEKGSNALFRFSSEGFQVIETLVRFFSSYLALVYFNLHSAYLVAFFTILAITMMIRFDRSIGKDQKEILLMHNWITAKIYDTVSNITTIITLKLEKLVSRDIWKTLTQPFALFVKMRKMVEWKWFSITFLSSIMAVAVLGTYVFTQLRSGEIILVGTLYVLYGYVMRINDMFFRFAGRYGAYIEQQAALENTEHLSKHFISVTTVRKIKLGKSWKKIRIAHLHFSYHDTTENLHLHDISLTIRRKERIALIGESGSGKTTFMKLLSGFYSTPSVNLTVDGVQIHGGFEALKNNITLIPQEPELFATTIRKNITVGLPTKITDIYLHSGLACFHHVAMRLPHKYESTIMEKGVNLSGGEKQRLALARGFLAAESHELLLLDEPTSSVDAKTEMLIYQNIFKKFSEKTIISSVHRLHLLPHFDMIYYFKKGTILASGSFEELLRTSKEFKTLWKKYTRIHAKKE